MLTWYEVNARGEVVATFDDSLAAVDEAELLIRERSPSSGVRVDRCTSETVWESDPQDGGW